RERLEPVSTEYMWEGRVRLKTKFPIFGADRELVAFGAVSTDVTEQRQALNALARQSSLLQALFDNLPDGVLYISNDLRVELANPGAAAMHGYELDELIGLPVDELFTGKVWEKVKRQFTDNPYHALQPRLTQFRRKDDSTYQAEVIAAPVVGSEQDVSGYVALQRDVTERERTSREHAQLSEQLRQSQKMQSLGQLTGGIAHDFNNILASVLGFTGLAQNYCESDERLSRYLREIELAGGRGRDLVKQMLAFGRASPGEPRVVDLGTKVASSMTLLKSTLPASVDFVTQLEPGRWALVDPVQFDQIMMNLVINARDAMDSRGKIYMAVHRISVEGEHCAACAQSFQGDYIALTVADQGPGVTQEIRARMFDPFFTTKDVGQGTGMGLSTVHGITHQHGGHILIDDTPGLAIRILFPVADEPVATEGPEPVLTSTQIKARACRVLVVDDERSVGQFLKELLEMHGHTVYAFASTVDALAWYQDHIAEIDIVVSDLTMPETPGDRFVAELRRLNPDLPAIVTTGIGHIEKQRRLKGLANCQTVDKPIDPAKLLEALAASAHDGLGDPPILKNR
ncbi:MAG: ATP-binding protein, partial [Pseudomonadota bacterium]